MSLIFTCLYWMSNLRYWKQLYEYIFLLLQVAETVRRSSRNGYNVPHIVNDAEDPVLFYEWKSYFQEFFKAMETYYWLPSLFHRFQASRCNKTAKKVHHLNNTICLNPNLDFHNQKPFQIFQPYKVLIQQDSGTCMSISDNTAIQRKLRNWRALN